MSKLGNNSGGAEPHCGSICTVSSQATLLALWILFSIAICLFASHQDIWIDESTQLSGITLTLSEMLQWLAGEDPGRFGVPGDRMPPFSYLLDWAWYRLPWGSIFSLRVFHGLILLGGAVVLGMSLRRTLGWPIALVATALFALSTRTIQTSVEIRAYPIFVALTCIALASSIRIVGTGVSINRRYWISLTLSGILLSYTHFFGAIAFYSLSAGLLWHFRQSRRDVVAVVSICALVAVTVIGVLPFALASSASSDSTQISLSAKKLLTYFAQLSAGSADLVIVTGAAAMFSGIGALLLASMTTLIKQPTSTPQRNAILLLLITTLSVGLITTIALSILAKGFDALKPTYSAWTLPVLASLFAVTWATPIGIRLWDRVGRHIAISALLLGTLAGTAQMLSSPSLYIHGPHKFLAQHLVPGTDSLILYETSDTSGYGYFPLRYSQRGRVAQWVVDDQTGSTARRIQDGPIQPDSVELSHVFESAERIIIASIRLDRFSDLRNYIHGSSAGLRAGPAEDLLSKDTSWSNETVAEQPGYYSTRVSVWRRKRSREN